MTWWYKCLLAVIVQTSIETVPAQASICCKYLSAPCNVSTVFSVCNSIGEEGDLLGIVKRVKFDQTHKWNMHKPESVQEIEMHKIRWDFEMQTNHIIYGQKTKLNLN